jgi:hypothetical protein
MASTVLLFIYVKIEPYSVPSWSVAKTTAIVLFENMAFAAWIAWLTWYGTRLATDSIPFERYEPWAHLDWKQDAGLSSIIFGGYLLAGLATYSQFGSYTSVLLAKKAVVMVVLSLGVIHYYYLSTAEPFREISRYLSTKDWGEWPPCPHMWQDDRWLPSL